MSEFDKCEERLFFITFYSPRLSNHPTHMITCDSEEDTKNFMPPLFCLSSSIVLNHLNSSREKFFVILQKVHFFTGGLPLPVMVRGSHDRARSTKSSRPEGPLTRSWFPEGP